MWKHSSAYFMYYFVFVSIAFFFAPFLITKGVETEVVGFLQSIGLFILIGSMLLFGYLGDTKLTNKSIIIINLIISFIAFVVLVFATIPALGILSFLIVFPTFMMLPPILDGLILKDLPRERYSKVRAMGSFGAAVSYFFNSIFVSVLTYEYLILFNALLIIIMLVITYTITESSYEEKTPYLSGVNKIMKNKNLILILIISFLTYGSIKADDAYSYYFNSQIVGMLPFMIGLMGFLSIMIEGTLMTKYELFMEKFGPKNLLYAAVFVLSLTALSRYLFYEFPIIIFLGSILLGFFIGIFVPVMINAIDQFTEDNVKNTMLSLYQISIALGGAIIGMITAILFTSTGVLQNIYLLHFFLVIFSLVFIYNLNFENQDN